MRYWSSDKCPQCFSPNETTLHVLTCNAPSAVQLLQERQKALLTSLAPYPTKPELLDGIRQMFNLFLAENSDESKTIPDNAALHPCTVVQLQLPTHEFVRGHLVRNWKEEQEQFLNQIRSRRSANRWAQLLMQEIWQLFFSLWLHRNETYHSDPTTQNKIQQLCQINREIRRQWAIGPHGIPQADIHHFLHIKLAPLLKKNCTISNNGYIQSS